MWGDEPLAVVPVTGPPGAGKTTALTALACQHPTMQRFGVRDYGLRLATAGDPLGLAMRDTLLRQELLSDDLVLREFNHFLDHLPDGVRALAVEGYPRDRRQCQDLLNAARNRGARVTAFVVVDIPDEVVRVRVMNRRLCSQCGRVGQEVAAARCVDCGAPMTKRRDDEGSRLERRLADYRRVSTDPQGYFAERGLLCMVDGLAPSGDVQAALADLLGVDSRGGALVGGMEGSER